MMMIWVEMYEEIKIIVRDPGCNRKSLDDEDWQH